MLASGQNERQTFQAAKNAETEEKEAQEKAIQDKAAEEVRRKFCLHVLASC